jgi:hypothetical protein
MFVSNRSRFHYLHRGDEAIASPRQRFYKTGIFSRVAQGIAQLVHRYPQAMVEIDRGCRSPKLPLKFFSGDDLARLFQQSRQQLEGLTLQSHLYAGTAKFLGRKVYLEDTELK